MNLHELKKYPMAEAIYINVFGVSKEDLENKSREEVITDYEHLEENVEEALETLLERQQTALRLVLRDGLTLQAAGDEMGTSAERVRRFLNTAFCLLRHPTRSRTLDGSRRQWRIEAEAAQKRADAIKENWSKARAGIEQQKSQQLAQINAQASLDISNLPLTSTGVQKLHYLGVKTVGELLEKFPYNSRTGGLKGLAVADGIEELDYQEIWCALFTAGLLICVPELPDFNALQKAEWSELVDDDMSKLNIPIDELELSVRSYNCLVRADIWSVGDLLDRLELDANELLEKGKKELFNVIRNLSIRNMGRKSTEEVANYLYNLLNND